MEYNKNKFQKKNDKKVLHKVRKEWTVVSLALLVALGGGAVAEHASAHADTTNNSLNSDPNKVNSMSSNAMGTTLNHSRLNFTSQASTANSASNGNESNNQKNGSSQAIMSQASSLHKNIVNVGLKREFKLGAMDNSQSRQGVINLSYENQSGQQLLTHNIYGKPGVTINVTQPDQGGVPVPSGYTLNSDQSVDNTFNPGQEPVTLMVTGNKITADNDNGKNRATIHITTQDLNKTGNTTVPDYITGRIGSDVTVSPGTYNPDPSKYYVNPRVDADRHVRINSDGSIDPTDLYFTYTNHDDNDMNAKMTSIYVHYQSITNPNHDIYKTNSVTGTNNDTTVSDNDYAGTPFDIKPYQTNIPSDYYYVSTTNPVKSFGKSNQDVVINVAPDVNAWIKYEDPSDNDKVVSDFQIGGKGDQTINYDQFTNPSDIPSGYKYDKLGSHDSVLKSGDNDIVLVNKVNDNTNGSDITPTPSPNPNNNNNNNKPNTNPNSHNNGNNNQNVANNGTITLYYKNNDNESEGTKVLSDKVGTHFDVKKAVNEYLPAGWYYEQIYVGNNVNAYTKSPQDVYVNVTNQKPDVDTQITYRDVSDNDTTIGNQSISAPAGTPIDYSKYENGQYLPSGYDYVGLGQHSNVVTANGDNVIYVKKHQVTPKSSSKSTTPSSAAKPSSQSSASAASSSKPNSSSSVAPASKSSVTPKPSSKSASQSSASVTPAPSQSSSASTMPSSQSTVPSSQSTVPFTPQSSSFNIPTSQTPVYPSSVNYTPSMSSSAPSSVASSSDESAPQKGTITVHYRNPKDPKHDKTIVVNGNVNKPFDINNYVNRKPSGTRVTGLADSSNVVDKFKSTPQSITFIVQDTKKHVHHHSTKGSSHANDSNSENYGNSSNHNNAVNYRDSGNSNRSTNPMGYIKQINRLTHKIAAAHKQRGKLPQTGEEKSREQAMGAMLIALGSVMGALGYAMDKRRRRDN